MRKLSNLWMVGLLVVAFGACTAEVEDSGEMPDVDVQGGEMPEVDVDPADVNISTDTQTVRVPDIDVVPQEDGR